ncbi:hypothetical protein SAMN05421848_2583 [Kushneria avicenniae]|uniref:Uncharacterized protein n=1 Tax=Kushneria avicenniae TaxID=402385 RepID=A0A1I1LVW7_9GAMM|nr:hypothetical protein [Kushneria avicenniae]SFC74463.1 hypothetical protein SAMN05421848_2583 [Kushneria avicenniae]
MSSDQASGLRQWSQARASNVDRPVPAVLVVMVWTHDRAAIRAMVSQLRLPAGVSAWQPRVLVLSEPLPEPLPASLSESSCWVLHPVSLPPREASGLASALRVLYRAGMPQTVLLTAPEPGLVRAARDYLGVRLVQDQQAWQEAVMAASGAG